MTNEIIIAAGYVIPAVGCLFGALYLRDFMRRIGYRPERNSSKPKPNEIAPGVPRPSNVLAGIIAQKILMSPEAIESKQDPAYPRRQVHTWKSKFPDKPIIVELVTRPDDGERQVISFTVKIEGETYDFKEDADVIKDAMRKGIVLKEEQDRAKKIEAHQQKACDLMEKVLGVAIIKED